MTGTILEILAVIVVIGAIAGWIVIRRLPRGVGRSQFDRIFFGTVVAFGTILALGFAWFIAGCVVRVPGIPLICQ